MDTHPDASSNHQHGLDGRPLLDAKGNPIPQDGRTFIKTDENGDTILVRGDEVLDRISAPASPENAE